jgi:hypothetical protein
LIGVDPEDYLVWVLPKLASETTATLGSVIPHAFKRFKERSQSASAPA